MLCFGVIGISVIICNILRLKVGFIRKSLLPVAVLAGFILLVLKETGVLVLDVDLLSIICYHAVAIGFIAMSLRVPKESEKASGLLGFRTGALAVGTYMFQIIIGMGIAFILALTFMPGFFEPSGMLLAYGFGQGPGQANNIGASFEGLGFAGGRSFGLALAAAGYLIAFVAGIIYIHIIKRKRESSGEAFRTEQKVTVEMFQDEVEAPASDSIDRLSVQVGLILTVYVLAYFFLKGFLWVVGILAGPGAVASLSGTVWGFNFLAGVLMAIIVRGIISKCRKAGVMKKQYQNNYLLSRISGCAFDIMIIAGIAAIELGDLNRLWFPFLLMAIIGGVGTFFFLKFVSHKVYRGYKDEAFLSMFGTWTGTISSGMILLRELDPDFSTPAANNMIIGSSYGILFGVPLLIITSGAPSNPLLWYGIVVAYFVVLMFIVFFRVGPKGEAARAARAEARAAKKAAKGN